jgi:hypothetical protein
MDEQEQREQPEEVREMERIAGRAEESGRLENAASAVPAVTEQKDMALPSVTQNKEVFEKGENVAFFAPNRAGDKEITLKGKFVSIDEKVCVVRIEIGGMVLPLKMTNGTRLTRYTPSEKESAARGAEGERPQSRESGFSR